MNDLISRSWLLDVIENVIQWDTERDRNRAIHQVRELTPAVQPERKVGEWINDGQYGDNFPYYAWRCSGCGECVIENDTPWFKFCPNCGAKMEGNE